MAVADRGWLSRRIRANAARQWTRILGRLNRQPGPLPPSLRDEARALQRSLTEVIRLADARVAAPRDSLSRMDLPAGTDRRWRPRIMTVRIGAPALVAPVTGRWLSDEVALFHDCPERALILRQSRNRRATDLTDYGLALEMMGFSGSFLSFSLTLPAEMLEDLGTNHILRLASTLQAERAITVYARLNIQQGPNTETILRQMGDPIEGRHCDRVVEFDLGYAELSHRSVDKAWLDLIFEAPYMNAVVLRDVILSRHPRAQI